MCKPFLEGTEHGARDPEVAIWLLKEWGGVLCSALLALLSQEG